jgi:hypothetical protein
MFFMNNVSASVSVILQPAGLESSVGLLSSAFAKDPLDPAFEIRSVRWRMGRSTVRSVPVSAMAWA